MSTPPIARSVVLGMLALTACAGTASSRSDDTLPPITTVATSTTSTPASSATPRPGAVAAAPSVEAAVASTSPPLGGAPPLELGEPPAAAVTTTTPGIGELLDCGPVALAETTGVAVADVTCRAGWALATLSECAPRTTCAARDLFHVYGGGPDRPIWVHVGGIDVACAEHLVEAGVPFGAAAAWAPVCDAASAPTATNIPPGSRDPRVPALQMALIALGYPIAVNGAYGPETEEAVRDFQARRGLEVDGIAGPLTQAALGM